MIHTVVYFTDTAGFGGAEQVMLTLIAGLDRKRWRPILVYHPSSGIVSLIEEARKLDVELWSIPPMPEGGRGAARVPSFARRLRSARPDVFHAQLTWPRACKFGLMGAVFARIPAIVATLQLFVEAPISRGAYMQQQFLFHTVQRYLPVSHAVERQMQRAYDLPAHKMQVIPNGISLKRFNSASHMNVRSELVGSSERPIVLTLARLDQQKGLQYLVQAAATVPDATFIIAGDGPERSNLEAQARQLAVSERVIFLGHRADIPDLLHSCDVFVLPSLYEGLPISVLEAQAARRPTIATDVEGTREVILPNETGLLVPARDPAALAAAIRTILSDRILAQHLVMAGYLRVRQEFSAELMCQRVTRLYDELLDDHAVG